jgi:hypothetical protein
MKACLWILALAMGCGSDTVQTVNQKGGIVEDDLDDDGPVIDHEPISISQLYLEDVSMEAWVFDDGSGVFVVEVVYKREDSTVWQSKPLAVDLEDTDFFAGEIPAADVVSGGMHYYLEATDREGNVSWDPPESEQDPFHFRITAD